MTRRELRRQAHQCRIDNAKERRSVEGGVIVSPSSSQQWDRLVARRHSLTRLASRLYRSVYDEISAPGPESPPVSIVDVSPFLLSGRQCFSASS